MVVARSGRVSSSRIGSSRVFGTSIARARVRARSGRKRLQLDQANADEILAALVKRHAGGGHCGKASIGDVRALAACDVGNARAVPEAAPSRQGLTYQGAAVHTFLPGGASGFQDHCSGKQITRRRTASPGRTCNVTLLLLCRPGPPLSTSIRIAVTPDGTTYSWAISHIVVAIGPSYI